MVLRSFEVVVVLRSFEVVEVLRSFEVVEVLRSFEVVMVLRSFEVVVVLRSFEVVERNLNLDPTSEPEGSKMELAGPPQKCVICGEEFQFSQIKAHRDPAIGDGVTRHIFATIMSKLQFGFDISFAPGGTLLFEGGGCWINYFSMLSLEEPPNKSSTYDEA
uniref:Uncharacterized protein n=1 Tax=Knipowitschia caucasica TaxID=637954 RepID=A0AAV2MDL3_KNICA